MIERRRGPFSSRVHGGFHQDRTWRLFRKQGLLLSFTEALHEELKPPESRHGLVPADQDRVCAVAGFGDNSAFDRLATDAASVVRAGLAGLDKNRAVVVPGLINKVGASSTRFAPRFVVRKIAGAIKF